MNSRSRGGRFTLPRREENDHMKEPNPDTELLNDLMQDQEHSKRRDFQHRRLHVSNVPAGMNEISLRQLFAPYGEPTVFLYQMPQHGQKSKRWGFIDFPTPYEANNALKLNNVSPFYLHLSYARIADENNETEDCMKKEIQRINDREILRGRGRGSHVPLIGRAPRSYCPKNPTLESYNNVEEASHNDRYSNVRFQHDNTPAHIVEANNIYSKLSKMSQGKRTVTMGRGVNRNEKIETYELPKISEKVEKKIDEFMNDLVTKPNREEIRGYSEHKLPFELGKCPNCDRVSTFVCCNCKEWYCSADCACDHLSKMGSKGCPDRKRTFYQEGRSNSETDHNNSYLVDKKYLEIEHNNQNSGNRGSRQFEDRQSSDTEQKQYRGNNNTSKDRNDRYSDGFDDKIPKHRGDDGGSRVVPGRPRRLNASSKANNSVSENDDEESVKTSSEVNKKCPGNNDRPFRFLGDKSGLKKQGNGQGNNKFQGKHARPDLKSFNNRNSQHDNDVYVRNDNDATQISRVEPSSVTGECSPICSEGEIAEVIISSATEDKNVYWAYKKTSLPDLVDMLKALNEFNRSSKPVQPHVDFVCAARFNNEWYRAKIIKIFEDKAVVRFIDYGNESKVKLDELILIPKELVHKPPLAFRIHVQGPPVNLKENEEIIIKLLDMDKHGAWRVTLDVDSPNVYPQDVADEISISYDNFDTVHIMAGQNDEYYVQLEHNIMRLVQMSKTLGEHASIKVEPKLGELYVKCYSDTWCRAKVINDCPLTVFYIDYGNSEEVDKKDLHPVPEEHKRLPGMALKIKLAEGTSDSYLNMEFSVTLSVKAVEKLTDGTFIVQIKGEKYEMSNHCESAYPAGVYSDKERNAKHVLGLVKDNDSGVWINVQNVMSSECLTGSLSLQTKSADYVSMLDISKLLRNIEPNRSYKPEVGDLVTVRAGSIWCRGYVMLLTEEDISVALVDYGKTILVKEKNITPLPPSYHTYPVRQAVRVILKTSLETKAGMIGNEIHLTNVKKLYNYLKCTFGDYGEAEIIAWRPLIEDAGLRVSPLSNNSLVILTAFHTPRSVYLQPAKKSEATKLSELLQDMTYYAINADPLKRKPLCGELLCVKYHEDGHFYRAQVFRKADEDTYKVNFVDYGNTEIVSVNDMKLLPDTYKKVPCFAVKVGLKDVLAHNFNPQAMSYINKLTLSEKILLLTYEDSLSEVTLAEQDGKILNTYLVELMESSLKTLEMPTTEHIKKFHPFTGEDVIYESWPPNSRINLLVLGVQDFRTVLALDQKSNLLKHLFTYLTPKITKYCEENKQTGYNPRPNEVILAKYKEEEDETEINWYRAICIKAMRSSCYVLFIDYGNCGELPHSDIRSMPPEFMESPAALKRCSVYGLIDSLSNDMKDKAKHMLEQFNGEAVVIEDNENGNSTLWIPSLYSKLQDIGFPRVDPPPGI